MVCPCISTIAQHSCCIIACSLLSHFASGYHTFVGVVARLLVSCSCCIHNCPVTLCGHYIHICTLCPAVAIAVAISYRYVRSLVAIASHLLLLFAIATCYSLLLLPFATQFAIALLFAIACYSICYCYLHMLYAHSHLMLRFATFRIRYHYLLHWMFDLQSVAHN